MPRISFNFRGWVSRANVTEATNIDGETVDVSEMPATDLAAKLEAGELFISLGDHLYSSGDSEIIMDDFDVPFHDV